MERVSSLTNIEQRRTEDEGQLMLLVVTQERHKGILTLVDEIAILEHRLLHRQSHLCLAEDFAVFDGQLIHDHLLGSQELDVRVLRFIQEDERLSLLASPRSSTNPMHERVG